MVGAAFICIKKAFEIIRFFVKSWRGTGPTMMKCVGLYLVSQVENIFVGLMGQTPRLMQLILEYLRARFFVFSYFLSTLTIFPKS